MVVKITCPPLFLVLAAAAAASSCVPLIDGVGKDKRSEPWLTPLLLNQNTQNKPNHHPNTPSSYLLLL